jgi:hypothetical protein
MPRAFWSCAYQVQFILLEVYGLCSGDKRSYEFVEAFHAKMLSVCP